MKEGFRIGFWVDEKSLPTLGGAYYYGNKLLQKLNDYNFENLDFEVCVVGFNLCKEYNRERVVLEKYKNSSLEGLPFIGTKIREYRKRKHERLSLRILKNENIKLIFYPSPHVYFENFPFIVNNWDVGHKSMFPFPEVSNEKQFFKREKFYTDVVSRALFICVESQSGKEELLNFYNINPSRIRVLPIFSGEVTEKSINEIKPLEVEKDAEFIFYPAQFWAHKNHYNLILAFNHLLNKNNKLKLVFTGQDKGNLDYLKALVVKLQLCNNILFLNFRELEEIKWLYKHAKALVMPTFLGPTNMPILEAMEFNCPVVCTDLQGHREILGEGGIYFDPTNFIDIAEKLSLSLNIKNQIKKPAYNADYTAEALIQVLKDSIPIRNCWH